MCYQLTYDLWGRGINKQHGRHDYAHGREGFRMRTALIEKTKIHLIRVLDAWISIWVCQVVSEALANPIYLRQWELAFAAEGIPFPYKLSTKSIAAICENQYNVFCTAIMS